MYGTPQQRQAASLFLESGGTRNMTSYEIAMLAIAVLSLIVNAVALFNTLKE